MINYLYEFTKTFRYENNDGPIDEDCQSAATTGRPSLLLANLAGSVMVFLLITNFILPRKLNKLTKYVNKRRQNCFGADKLSGFINLCC